MFTRQGYSVTGSRDIEPGFQKVALYVRLEDMSPTHFAISSDRTWKSKLGRGVDIEHANLDVLEGDAADEYGIVDTVFRRPRR
jgi:hypothetical protein